MKTLFRTVGVLLALSIAPALQAQDDLSPEDVIGKFAPVGSIGPLAGTKTMSEAHVICIDATTTGERSYSEADVSTDADFYNSYKSCMADYVPFRGEGQGEAGSCGVTSVTWGQCSANVEPLANGQVTTVKNTGSEEFEGHASFRCENGAVKFQTGGCSAVADACEAGLKVYWGVTSPLWADNDPTTVHLDRYGQPRHTPKASCGAEMGEAESGEFVLAKATVPETSPADRYDVASATSPQRCFNNEFIREPGSGAEVCGYIPRNCEQTVYTHPNGCTYNIPVGNHDQIFRSSSPAPENSVGSLEAYCWDGEWEVKAATCQMSCEPTIPAYEWAPDYNGNPPATPRQCAHSEILQASRIPPSTDLRIDNETEGLNGEAVYTCDNGNLGLTGEDCRPKNCEGIPANSWGSGDACSHEAMNTTLTHGETLNITRGTPFTGIAKIGYRCDHGSLVIDYTECGGGNCSDPLDPNCICDEVSNPISPTPTPGSCTEGVIIEDGSTGYCCTTSDDGSVSCDKIYEAIP